MSPAAVKERIAKRMFSEAKDRLIGPENPASGQVELANPRRGSGCISDGRTKGDFA